MGIVTIIEMIIVFYIGNKKNKLSNNTINNILILFIVGVSLWNILWYAPQHYQDIWGRMSLLSGLSSIILLCTQMNARTYKNLIRNTVNFMQKIINSWTKIAIQLVLMFCIIRYGYELVIINIY